MTPKTEYLDKLNSLFREWTDRIGICMSAAWDGTHAHIEDSGPTFIDREVLSTVYQLEDELVYCIYQLPEETEHNLLSISHDQHGVSYINKLAKTYESIDFYLNTFYPGKLKLLSYARFEYEQNVEPLTSHDNNSFQERGLAGMLDNEEDTLTKLIKNIGEGFAEASNLLYDTITKSLSYKHYPELINIASPGKLPFDSNQPAELDAKGPWKNLPPKILLLDKLGFFDLPEVKKLSFESKGKLVSTLCGGSADNAVDYVRYCDPERTALEKNPYRNPKNLQMVAELLDQLNGG